MTTAYDVPPEILIPRIAEKLKGLPETAPPDWAKFVKTGVHREKSPVQEDWWHMRLAAVLRKVYVNGPIGVSRIKAHYGGPVDRGSKPNRSRAGSGSIARRALQQLEAIGYVTSEKGIGRTVSPKGRSLLDNLANEVKKGMIKSDS